MTWFESTVSIQAMSALYAPSMALLLRATLTPSKLELLRAYTNGGGTEILGAYRFDDPSGEVGIETHLVAHSFGTVLHLPLTYRARPLDGAEEWFVGNLEHSVLGTRWVYNACADPVYATQLLRAILTGGQQVEQYFETNAGREIREPTATVRGSGSSTTAVPTVLGVHAESFDSDTLIDTGSVQVVVRHSVDVPEPEPTSEVLSGTWSGTTSPALLAYIA